MNPALWLVVVAAAGALLSAVLTLGVAGLALMFVLMTAFADPGDAD